jgi:hypothetical protein
LTQKLALSQKLSTFKKLNPQYHENDLGITWDVIYSNPYMDVYSLSFSDSGTLYLGTDSSSGDNGGVWKSSDDGNTWELMYSNYIEEGTKSGLVKVLFNDKLYCTPTFGYSDLIFRFLGTP